MTRFTRKTLPSSDRYYARELLTFVFTRLHLVQIKNLDWDTTPKILSYNYDTNIKSKIACFEVKHETKYLLLHAIEYLRH